MLKVKNAKYIENFKIKFEFNNGIVGIIDLSNTLWGEMFEPLKEINLFKDFKISEISNTIEWNNGADLSPEYLLGLINE